MNKLSRDYSTDKSNEDVIYVDLIEINNPGHFSD